MNVSEKQNVMTVNSNDVTKSKLIKTSSVDLLQVTQYFFGKNNQHDQWNVLNLLTYNFGMKNNFEQGGIVPLITEEKTGFNMCLPKPEMTSA